MSGRRTTRPCRRASRPQGCGHAPNDETRVGGVTWAEETGTFSLGDLPVAGGVLQDAVLSWKTYGSLSPSLDNVILYPTSFGIGHTDQEWLIGPGKVLDPTRWFIVTPNLFGNGFSSSPSNRPDWPPLVTYQDNVDAQMKFLAGRFGISRIACVYGYSMGAQQAYHWAARHPEAVDRIIVVCGSARTSEHNRVFLSGLRAVLETAPEHLVAGRFSAEPIATLRAFGRIYAGWGLSQDFYRAGLHLSAFQAASLEEFLRVNWEDRFARRSAANLHAQLCTWHAGDVAAGQDLAAALRRIRAAVLLLPGETDLYFRVADNEAELPCLKQAELRVIPSKWGHRAGNPLQNPEDAAFLAKQVRRWLS
nr:alpha/beta fold hydrolase [Hypericibacter adhaerens]